MDALIPAFVVAGLAEIGDGTQLLAILLALRFRRPLPILLGIALAAIVNMGLGAAAGVAVADVVNHRAIQLMTGLSLVLAASGALFRVKRPATVDSWKLGSFLSSFGAFFILEFGDKTQFVAATIAAGSGRPILTAIGAALGVTLANVPAVILADRWPRTIPLRPIRIAIGVALALAGAFMAIRALGIG